MPNYHDFIDTGPKRESSWRGIVLLGANVQSYKFALAQSLIGLASDGRQEVTLEELAVPFSEHLCAHLKTEDKQGTPRSSQFLDTCRAYNKGNTAYEQLIETTVRLGFNNVLDAFHVVGNGTAPVGFFQVAGNGVKRKVSLTDDVFHIASGSQAANLKGETEARWRLVEAAWRLGIETRALVGGVALDEEHNELVIQSGNRRISLAGARGAVGGYQKGVCFYCGLEITEEGEVSARGEVDHFIPWSLGQPVFNRAVNLDGVWNLVVACQDCNRGGGGKLANLPSLVMLDRLNSRNEFYIFSHHPLREALIAQTGSLPNERSSYLNRVWQAARDHGLSIWEPIQRAAQPF
jgi:hypothetical protein